MGTVTVRFMMDVYAPTRRAFRIRSDVDTVAAYLDQVRPVAIKDMFVVAPIRQPIHVEINGLMPDTLSVRAAINASLQAMILDRAEPGGTMYAAWKNYAIMSAPGVESFTLANADDDRMPSNGHMPVLGNVIYQ